VTRVRRSRVADLDCDAAETNRLASAQPCAEPSPPPLSADAPRGLTALTVQPLAPTFAAPGLFVWPYPKR
jgi:hypothetical protein